MLLWYKGKQRDLKVITQLPWELLTANSPIQTDKEKESTVMDYCSISWQDNLIVICGQMYTKQIFNCVNHICAGNGQMSTPLGHRMPAGLRLVSLTELFIFFINQHFFRNTYVQLNGMLQTHQQLLIIYDYIFHIKSYS